MENCTLANTALLPGDIFVKSDEDKCFDNTTEFRAAIGSLMLASVTTRPDIAYSTNLLAQFNGEPSQKHKARHTELKFPFTAYSDAENGKGHDRRNYFILQYFMEEMKFRYDEPTSLFMDSDGAIALTKNPENMRAIIHINKVYHWIRHERTFSPESIPVKENSTDKFTKSLDILSFNRHKSSLGTTE
ncbi:hypothetical protein EPUL_004378 [Erysiphe pulchra]|uniref:Uncharacterized protein n=1 Tax=Erysiphe pulchra TaxID=225359 RepID=A0A2S4PV25_9PEZI|nr:hypothetical protein EPUL_004378 [Erysiphe pulchra]